MSLERFLRKSKELIKSGPKSQKINFTLGNESCDLDSTIASISLSYYLDKTEKTKSVPILNVTRNNFHMRTENCFVLNQAKVPVDILVFRDEVEFTNLVSNNDVTISLVDHHILSRNDKDLAPLVREIYDHRPVDFSYKWDSTVRQKIEPVGSCCTLIADKLLSTDGFLLENDLAYLLYQTIVFDTIALKPENNKATPLDIQIGEHLESLYSFNEDRQVLFDRLWAVHNDVSKLTLLELLSKDMKLIGGVYIPGLPMLVEEYLSLDGSLDAVETFVRQREVSCILLVGLQATDGEVKRDLAIFSEFPDDKLRKSILNTFDSCTEYDFQFEKRETELGNKFHLLHVHNTKLSRKQLVPLVMRAWMDYSCH